MKFFTEIDIPASPVRITRDSKVTLLGSCFADQMGERMQRCGLDACVNPFGTLYNPVSVANAAARLGADAPFSEVDCVQMGAGADLICSFSHHTSFARSSAQEFLDNANAALHEAAAFWQLSDVVIVTLGTSFCYMREGEVVANCLKRDASEFTRTMLNAEQSANVLSAMVRRNPDKLFVFTVSPIRHLADGAHANSLSKAALLQAADALVGAFPGRCHYFPAFEIMMDELRDYRFYAEDLVHPNTQAADYIWEKFVRFCIPDSEKEYMKEAGKRWKAMQHRPMHR